MPTPAARTSPEASSIGRNLATVRKARGLSQQQLAERLHVSRSLVEKIEHGSRTATPALIEAAARVLGCSITDLSGQPYRGENHADEQAHATVGQIRRAISHHDLPPDLDTAPRPLFQLREDVRRVNRLRHHARLTAVGAMIPGLITELTAATHTTTGDQQAEAFALLVEAYAAANQVAYKLGYEDLSNQLVDRIRWAAGHTGDPLIGNLADWMYAGYLRTLGFYRPALGVLHNAWRTLDLSTGRMTPRQLSMYGSLHLQAAMVEARAGHPDDTRTHLTEAADAAGLLRVDTDHFQLAFGPSNTAIYRVATAVELGDGTRAVTEAATIRLPSSVPVERSAHHYLDLSRAWLWHGNREQALRSLLKAERLAPQQTRIHPMARETVRVLLRQDRRRSDSLSGLAKRVHVAL
ncbi:MAG: helix-turn-helix domain-containing protein [Pseudonocardiaceae bacterium]